MNSDTLPTIPDGFTPGFAPSVDPDSDLVRIGCIASPADTSMDELRALGFTHCEPMEPGILIDSDLVLFEFSGTITRYEQARRQLERLHLICAELIDAWEREPTPGHFIDAITLEPSSEEPEDELYSESILGRLRFEVRHRTPMPPATTTPTDA